MLGMADLVFSCQDWLLHHKAKRNASAFERQIELAWRAAADYNSSDFQGVRMAKGARDKIKLVSSEGTGVFYTTTKKKGEEKIQRKKYDRKLRKHVVFKESKMK
jgi:large subunit ribosomal protein L33